MSLLNICFDKNNIFIIPETDKQKFVYLYYLIEENKIDYLQQYIEKLNNSTLNLESLFFIERFYFNNFNISTLLDFPHIQSFLKKDENNFYFTLNYESIYYLSSLQDNKIVCNFLLHYVDLKNPIIFYSNLISNNICFINYEYKDKFLLEDYFNQYIKNKNDPDLLLYFLHIYKDIDFFIYCLIETFHYNKNVYNNIIYFYKNFIFCEVKFKIKNYSDPALWFYNDEDLIELKNQIIKDIEKVHIQSMIMDF